MKEKERKYPDTTVINPVRCPQTRPQKTEVKTLLPSPTQKVSTAPNATLEGQLTGIKWENELGLYAPN